MKKEKIFWGIYFILAAVFLVVSKLGIFREVNFFSLLFTVFLVACLVKSLIRFNYTGILFSIAFLCIIYDEVLHITAITPWTVLLAASLGSIGLNMIFGHRHKYHKDYVYEEFDTIDEVKGDNMRFENSFGSSIKYVNSDCFEKAKINCSFGAMKVYFDNALIQKGEAIICLDVSFAGVELYIPKTWNVVNHVDCSFGGIEEKNRNQSNGSPTVVLSGSASFSGVTIIYV